MYKASESLDPTLRSNLARIYVNSPSADVSGEGPGSTPAPMETPRRCCMTWVSSSVMFFRRIEYPIFRPLQYTAHTNSSRSFFLCVFVSLSSASRTTSEAISLWKTAVSMGSSIMKMGGRCGSSWIARQTRPFLYPNNVPVVALSVNIGLLRCFPSSATILQPVVSMGRSLNMRRRPPAPLPDGFLFLPAGLLPFLSSEFLLL